MILSLGTIFRRFAAVMTACIKHDANSASRIIDGAIKNWKRQRKTVR